MPVQAPIVPTVATALGDSVRAGSAERRLRLAGVLFAIAITVHNGDHLRRGVDRLSGDVFALGTVGIVFEVALVVLIFQRHWLASLAATLLGAVLALGYVEVHFLPRHGLFSDSFTSAAHVSPLSWFAASSEIAAALAVAVAGYDLLRARGGLASLAAQNRVGGVRAKRTHPIVAFVALSQAGMLMASLVQVIA